MIKAFDGKAPHISELAFVSEWAYVVGDVEIGEGSGVWPGAVIRGDFGAIKIGRNSQIEDNSVIHAGADMEIGDSVIIGHSAVIHGLKIGHNVLIGNNATILDFVEIGDNCIVGANSMVPTGMKIPDNSYVIGVPAEIKRKLPSGELNNIRLKIAEKYRRIRREDLPEFSYAVLVRKYREQGL